MSTASPSVTSGSSWIHSIVVASWLAIVVLHGVGFALPLITGAVHVFLSLPIASQTQSHIRISTFLMQISGASYIFVALLHLRAGLTMISRSIVHRDWIFRAPRDRNTSAAQKKTDPAVKPATRRFWIWHWSKRVWSNLFGLRGLFGLQGRYFDEALVARETLEIVLQTYQLDTLSYSVSTVWANRLAVFIVVINCFVTPVVDVVFRHSRHRTTHRAAHLVLDMSLDFCSAMVIPMCILYPYLAKIDWEIGTVPASVALNDVWYAKAVATVRQVLVSSLLDFLSSMMPQASFLGCLNTLKHLLTRVQQRYTRSQHASSRVISINPTKSTMLANTPKFIASTTRTSRIFKRLLQVLYVTWGSLILAAHITSTRYSIEETQGCRLGLYPWYATGVPCVVMQINCHLQEVRGTSSELQRILAPLDRGILTQLIVTHCPTLEVPSIVTEFKSLISFEIYNCSLLTWSSDAAFTQDTNPAVGYVYLMYTNVSEFPVGLMHSNLPSMLGNFRIDHSNLTELPEALGDAWSSHHFFSVVIENMRLGMAPPLLKKLSVDTLSLTSCEINEIDDDFFQGLAIEWLWLSGNPLSKLPDSVGGITTLSRLILEATQLTALPPSLSGFVDASIGSSRRLWLYGSPVCQTPAAEAWQSTPAICAVDHNSKLSSFRYEYVLPQRGIDFE